MLNCRVSALDCGEKAACWVSDFLQRNCRLIEHYKQDGRTCKLRGTCTGTISVECTYRTYTISLLSFSPCRNSLFYTKVNLFRFTTDPGNETLTLLYFFSIYISTSRKSRRERKQFSFFSK